MPIVLSGPPILLQDYQFSCYWLRPRELSRGRGRGRGRGRENVLLHAMTVALVGPHKSTD